MWIGINDINTEAGTNGNLFQKVTGGLISFVNFHVNQPSDTNGTEDCVHYDFGNPDWNDFPCGSTVDIAHFACEFERETIFSESFTQGEQPTLNQCIAWNEFRADLNGSFTRVTIRGDLNSVGVTCTGAPANTLCSALHNEVDTGAITCDGLTWRVSPGCGAIPGQGVAMEINADGTFCNCTSAPLVRPCIGNNNWGGVGGQNCGATTQTMEVICE
jgi:hypothetical protein